MQRSIAVMVSDQPSWGRRLALGSRAEIADRFQTNPRGVGGETALRGEFRLRSFRPTLVGSEDHHEP